MNGKEAAKYLGIGYETLRGHIKRGMIVPGGQGKRSWEWNISEAELERFKIVYADWYAMDLTHAKDGDIIYPEVHSWKNWNAAIRDFIGPYEDERIRMEKIRKS